MARPIYGYGPSYGYYWPSYGYYWPSYGRSFTAQTLVSMNLPIAP